MATLYVNPTNGNDAQDGSQGAPFKTITKALSQASAGTTIQLAAGDYTSNSGESFPLEIPSEVKVVGNEDTKGNGISINGYGEYNNLTFGSSNITVLAKDKAELRGVTVTNNGSRGTGVWIESRSGEEVVPVVANNTFTQSNREGVLVTGEAKPKIIKNKFVQNDGNGISFVKNAKGEVRGNTFENTGYGINIGDESAPLLEGNLVFGNRTGILVQAEAHPVLRNNEIRDNNENGLTIIGSASADLGQSSDPGENLFRDNQNYDIENTSSNQLFSVGNQLQPSNVKGNIEFASSEVPTPTPDPSPSPTPEPSPSPSPTPPSSGEPQPAPAPSPEPSPQPSPQPSPAPDGQLTDIQGHWAETFIQAMVNKGIISGFTDGTFKPDDSLTRAQYAAILANAFDLSLQKEAIAFSDVGDDFWGKQAITKATRMGFISGYPDGTFRPNQNLTRTQTIVSLISGLGLTGGPEDILALYKDRAQIPSYATDEVATATAKRIVVNAPEKRDRLEPMRDITRAEVAASVYQAMVSQGQAEAIASDAIVMFSDIDGHWAEDFIRGMAKNPGVLSGFQDGSFKPDEKLTRAQFAALLNSSYNLDAMVKNEPTTFSDVPDDFWGSEAIQKAYRAAFLLGYGDGTFRPNNTIKKVEAIVSLVNGLGLQANNPDSSLQKLNDADSVPDWAREPIAAAIENQILVNHPNPSQLNPNQEATRAEVVAVMYQMRVNSGTEVAINSDYILTA
jgi:parallel beta-helix repeat protein